MDDQLAAATAMARAVKRARGALIEAVRSGLHGEGSSLRAAHAQVFESLDPEGTRLTVLAERAQMSHQAMGELVDELESEGYLQRIADPADRRARLVRATPKGRDELARAAIHLRRLYARWQRELHGLSAAEVVAALETFIRVCEEPHASRHR